MNFNFFIIAYSVIYAKYNCGYNVPKNMPFRYFDGKDWKVMKARSHLRASETSRFPNFKMASNLWSEINQKIKRSEKCTTTIRNTRIAITTTNEITTKPTITVKPTTTEKTTQPTTTETTSETITPTTTTTEIALENIIPKVNKTKISHVNLKATFVEMTTVAKTQKKTVTETITKTTTPKSTKMRTENKGISCCIGCERKLVTPILKIIRVWTWAKTRKTTKTIPKTTERPFPRTTLPFTFIPVKTTIILCKKIHNKKYERTAQYSERPAKEFVKQNDRMNKRVETSSQYICNTGCNSANNCPCRTQDVESNHQKYLPKNWWNLMEEFVDAIKSVKNKTLSPLEICDFAAPTKRCSKVPLNDVRRAMNISNVQKFINITDTDGRKKSGRPNNSNVEATPNKILEEVVNIQGQTLNNSSLNDSAQRFLRTNEDNVQYLDIKPGKNATTAKNLEQNDENSQFSKLIAYLNELKAENAQKGYNHSQNSNLNAFLNILNDKFAKMDSSKNKGELVRSTAIETLVPAKYVNAPQFANLARIDRHITKNQDNFTKNVETIEDTYAVTDDIRDMSVFNRTDSKINGLHTKDSSEELNFDSVINEFATKYIPENNGSLRKKGNKNVYSRRNYFITHESNVNNFDTFKERDQSETIESQTNYKDSGILDTEEKNIDRDFSKKIVAYDRDEQNAEDKVTNNDQETPLFDFKYALDDREQIDESIDSKLSEWK